MIIIINNDCNLDNNIVNENNKKTMMTKTQQPRAETKKN